MRNLKLVATFVIILVVIGAVSYGAWQLKRKVHYSFSYEAQVQSTVCEMVKPEYLKEPC